MIVDNALYVDGRRVDDPHSLHEAHEACCQTQQALAWIGLDKPAEEELAAVAEEFGLHELAVEDSVKAHQRPKLERYDGTLFVVLRPARYLEKASEVEFSEAHVFVGHNFVVTVRHGEVPAFSAVRRRLESEPKLLSRGPEAILHAIMDEVVDDYVPVVEGIGEDIQEVEAEVFGGNTDVSRRIYGLSREVSEFLRATKPLGSALKRLLEGGERESIDMEVRRYLRDVFDHVARVVEQVEDFQGSLANILNVNLTMVTVRQNNQVRKISAWAAILIVPTIVSGIYGMNYKYMPELTWRFGYPYALILMVAICVVLYLAFRRAKWL
jgi:magnesium transporter